MSRITGCLFAALFALVLLTTPGFSHERTDGGYFTIVDESGTAVYLTGRAVDIGDQFLTEQNKRYEVVAIEGNIAQAKFIGNVNLSLYQQTTQSRLAAILAPKLAYAQTKGKVAIYHTHTDESYVPTDGVESKLGSGSIYKVGASFANSLKSQGLEVIHSDAKFDPHDNMAYERSRRAAMDLVKQQPSAMFDVHRDAVPPEVYGTKMDGKDVSKVQLVVGKYGPTGKQIEDYALQIKAAADKQHPGLVKGIFFAKGGDYNQDLLPRSMLLEVGAHTNTLESAERGIALFADVIPSVIGAVPAPAAQAGKAGFGTTEAGPSGASKSIGWILGALVLGGIAFLVLSTGSLKEAGSKLKQFTTNEFANFFGPKTKKYKRRKDDDEGSK
ncbi:MAG: stage II sporulation protein P [Negativicutes bacterium]|nr:stage II sporulation protein P [Negativicutes bacterium]